MGCPVDPNLFRCWALRDWLHFRIALKLCAIFCQRLFVLHLFRFTALRLCLHTLHLSLIRLPLHIFASPAAVGSTCLYIYIWIQLCFRTYGLLSLDNWLTLYAPGLPKGGTKRSKTYTLSSTPNGV